MLKLTDLLWLFKDAVKVPKATSSRKFPKDLAEKFLRVHAGAATPVLMLTCSGSACLKPS